MSHSGSLASSTLRNAVSLFAGAGLSRILGFVRDILFAYILGAGWVADIFLAAFRLPHFARRLLQEGTLSLSFIPAFKKAQTGGNENAFIFARTVGVELFLFNIAFVLLCVFGAGLIAKVFLPGFASTPSLIELASRLLSISLFYLPLAAGAAVAGGVLMALGHYKIPAASPVALNTGLLISAALVLLYGYSGYFAARVLCWGLLGGGLLQFLLHIAALKRYKFSFKGPLKLNDPNNIRFVKSLPFSMLGSAAYQVNVLIAMLIASFLPEGSISALYYAERLIELPMALVGVSLGTASMAAFATLAIEERRTELSIELKRILGMVFFLTVPAAFGLVAFALPLIQSIFWRGAFDVQAIALTSTALFFYAPALPAVAASRILLSALNARGNTLPTVAAAIASLLCMVVFAFLLMPSLQLAGVALAASIAAWINFALLLLAMKRSNLYDCTVGFFPHKKFIFYTAISIVMATVMAMCNLLALHYNLSNGIRLAVGIPLACAVYFGLAALLKSPELKQLRGLKK
ncbi:murein biosynthesis integral membrane protein MurJ [Desulfovibrio sp. OttesenSCG-928-F07]|nr:murein biosynthesis integral membrane protein MurJ [Desulfovibrio sp. OttesenSCG-928-F07]